MTNLKHNRNHTGWYNIEGNWNYAYVGGTIGDAMLDVKSSFSLERYIMDNDYVASSEVLEHQDLVAASMLPFAFEERIGVPLVALTFLAPLREALMQCGETPNFPVWLVGPSGTRKTTLAAVMLSFYGKFNHCTMNGSFYDSTSYFLANKSCILKDMLVVIDDYVRLYSISENRAIRKKYRRLLESICNAGRTGRLNMDRYPCNAEILFTGVELPYALDVEISRCYVIQIGSDDIPGNGTLSAYQTLAKKGALAHLMRKYIEWLAPQMNDMPRQLKKRLMYYRGRIKERQGEENHMAIDQAAYLMTAYNTYLDYLWDVGLRNSNERSSNEELERAYQSIISNQAYGVRV